MADPTYYDLSVSGSALASAITKAGTALQSTDIGSTVQGYDANTVKKNVPNTFLAQQIIKLVTEQFRLAYDDTKYASFTIDSSGNLAVAPVGNFGVGVAAPAAKAHIISASSQLRLGYDATKYCSFTVDSAGSIAASAVGGIFYFTSPSLTTGAVTAKIGHGRTDNGYSTLDLIGDATYWDYGLRIQRYNTGADANSWINHRGTGFLAFSVVEAGSMKFRTTNIDRVILDKDGNLVIGTAQLADNATNGFLYIPGTTGGAPSGTPTAYAGRHPMVVDDTNNRLYIWNGSAWKYATLN